MTDFDKLNVSQLPPKNKFYSKLNDSNISHEEYEHAQNVWKEFNCKTMRDYHDLYLKTDVLLLADVMGNYRNICIDNYGLDPLWYYTAPGLALDAALKISKIILELITDPDMCLMIESGIRGGISTIMKRHAKANDPYIGKIREKTPIEIMNELKKITNEGHQFSVEAVCEYFPDFSADEIKDLRKRMERGEVFNPEQVIKYIMYLDANNLYGWAMSQPLPVDGFEWMKEPELPNWNTLCDGKECILEVDLEYPKDLHDVHNEYPLAPERLRVNKVDKLIPNLNNKKKYVLHHRSLKQYLDLGLKFTKIHRGTTEFEKDFFNLMNNSVFGKTMENIRNRVDVRLVTEEKELEKLR